MNGPLPIIRLPPTLDSRVVFWRYMYAHGLRWCNHDLDEAIYLLPTYEDWQYAHAYKPHDLTRLRHGKDLKEAARSASGRPLTLVNSPGHFVAYVKRLGASS